ncbi:TPA: ATP-binding cassette domain-containing protein, partial [Streptococcus equi subsp. equi]|nr:ATP-binding cassette domain-containing protein [Streptococcus equi subsp. equi]HEK9294625.1 ATP-binding cassette domain-containing protein [Streptococcus equi subsp. equi]HEK9297010.1 ATP-binding cassette domain-containing protein [Streptococcus equi subsp. equi]HEK9302996.1 ATP-binding cassette domain-containing protein [Streptococcus equi subsp. equi]HEK9305045.1 ATP-binding cassette domain-containing protein [Streptococcus equi subsp. equi]
MDVKIQDIRKSYKDRDILKGVSFEIQKGTICGLLGINGAGKSTLMKIIFGLEKVDSGNVIFYNQKDQHVNYEIGALIESPAIYMNLSAFDNLKTRALLYNISGE